MDHETAKLIAARALAALLPELTHALEKETQASKSTELAPGEEVLSSLKTHLGSKSAAAEALSDLEAAPADPDAQAALKLQIRKRLLEDDAFAAELYKLLGMTGEENTGHHAVNRSVAGSQILGNVFTGDISGSVNLNSPGEKDLPSS